MAKLGSEKNPLILRLADESKIDDIAKICDEMKEDALYPGD